jgi:biopolymer transport protein ExbD
MSTSANNEDGDHGFQIAPMVDIVFVLLLFFMTYKNLRELHVEASISGVEQTEGVHPPIFVDISTDETVTINGTVVAQPGDSQFEELGKWLSAIRASSTKEEPFVIRATNETRHERVVRVLSVLNKAGYKRVSFI